ncbi:hypothetical protein KCU95_g9429, partial [Aureobasidium melanogenum]
MTEVVKKQPPPPRPLECSSPSDNQILRADGEALLEPTETSESDGVCVKPSRIDSVLESNEVRSDLKETGGTVPESSTPQEASADSSEAHTSTSGLTDDSMNDEDRQQIPLDEEHSQPLAKGDDESVDDRSAVLSDQDFKGRLFDVIKIILSVDSRLKSAEKKLNIEPPPKQKAEVDGAKPSERTPCIPQMRVLDWYNFKHKWTGDKGYAIEVLKSPAKYYQDWAKEQRNYEKSKKTGNSPVHPQSDVEQENLTPQDVPERIRIISAPLLAIITELDPFGYPLDLTPGIMLRPYRRLVRMEDDLMKHLANLEAKWGVAEREDLERKVEPEPSHEHISREDKVTSNASPEASLTADETSQDEPDKTEHQSLTSSDPLTDSIEALRDLRCLKRFFETYIHPTVSRLRNRTARKIKFADLWYLFPHGEEVFVPSAHETEARSIFTQSAESSRAYQSVYRVYDHSGGRVPLSMLDDEDLDDVDDDDVPTSSHTNRADPFCMMCYHIDWDSKSYSPVSHEIRIKAFDNEKDITSLEVYPAGYHENFETIRQQLVERGRKFLKLTKPTHMSYHGRTYSSHPCGPMSNNYQLSATSFVESEVMIDFEQTPGFWRPNFGLEDCFDYYPRESREGWDFTLYQDKEHNQIDFTFAESIFRDYDDEGWLRDHAREKDAFLRDWDLYRGGRRSGPIQDLVRSSDLILLPSRVMGYSYRDRTFNAFNIDHLEPVTRKSEGFDGLELPKGHRELVEALVKEHFIKKEAYEKHGRSTPGMDIVSGKGKGLVILLHGFPGVGKTSTAECVAQSTGRPLFPITCGDLGLEPGEVEKSLTDKFWLAAKRDKVNMRRNALVSIFLRVLEYYDGILFLTTNRVGTFDDAFKLRIHVSLCYPPLTKAQTIKIWEKNLDRLKKIENARAQITGKPRLIILEGEILAYAEEHYKEHKHSKVGLWNGRQIRNAFLTAAALAYHSAGVEGPVLTTQLFKNVAKTTDEFDKYINSVHGEKNEEQRAYDHLERIDHLTQEGGKRNRGTHTTPQPVTPRSHPRGNFFSDNGTQSMQKKLDDSGYASHGGMVEYSSEHATFATSSANSSRVITNTTHVPESLYALPGAINSPSLAAKAARLSTLEYDQSHGNGTDSDEEDEED